MSQDEQEICLTVANKVKDKEEKDGKVVKVKNKDGSDLIYAPDEPKRMEGARIYSNPNGCCWKWLPGVGWRCVPC